MKRHKITKINYFIIIISIVLFLTAPTISLLGKERSSFFKNGVVVSDSDIATNIGVEILKSGGNAIDAAVSVAFVLAVVFPQAGNIGGGGFLIYREANGNVSTFNYREVAPIKANRNMYLDEKGSVIEQLSIKGPLAVAVPGTVAGLYLAWQKYGSIPWKDLLQPAINIAENGFYINKELADDLKKYANEFKSFSSSAEIFLDKKSKPKKEGSLLVQKDLAKSLKIIAEEGFNGFYKGYLAQKITSEIEKDNGIISIKDFESYNASEIKPRVFNYKNYTIYTMDLPSSGGILLEFIFKILEQENISTYKHNSVSYVHLITEILKRAYAERAEHLGDPNFYPVPTNSLLSFNLLNKIRSEINRTKPTPSSLIKPTQFPLKERDNTTHFSIVDKYGNAVSNTYTLNGTFGSFYIAKGTGILLNNEMDDFSIKPGIPNMYGLLGSEANAIEPRKQMLSSMTPTIIEKDNKLFAVLGSPGGSRIITSVMQVILNLIEFKMPPQEAVYKKRFHHQWFPDVLYLEDNFNKKTESILKQIGYKIEKKTIGRVNAIIYDQSLKAYIGVADPRGDGKANGF